MNITQKKVGEFTLSRTEILTQIKTAEKAANDDIEAARIKSKEDVSEARREAVKKIQEEEAKKRASVDAAITAKNKELAARRDELLDKGRAEAEKIDKRSSEKKKEIREFLNKEFERPIDVSS